MLGLCNLSTDPPDTSDRTNVITIDNALADIYGSRFVDVRRWLIDNGLTTAGITPTTADTLAVSQDRIPFSLMSDSTHLNAAGYTALGKFIASVITAKAWIEGSTTPPPTVGAAVVGSSLITA